MMLSIFNTGIINYLPKLRIDLCSSNFSYLYYTKTGIMDELHSYYRSAITIQLKHGPIPTGEAQKLYSWLESIGTELQKGTAFTTVTVGSEQKIAEIIHALMNCHVNIFRVEVNEPSLEAMFLAE